MSGSDRPLLALDASTSTGSVAVGGPEGVKAEITFDLPHRKRGIPTRAKGGHSSALLPAIDHALRTIGLGPRDLGGVVVGAGPGSFTGLRIAAATAKGMVMALQLPLLAYSSLLAAAAQAWAADRPVYALFDARGRDLFAACYRFDEGVRAIRAPAATTLDALMVDLATLPGALLVGDGAERHRVELEASGHLVAPPHFHPPRASGLLWLAEVAPSAGRVADPRDWEPEYLRPSGAERIAAAKQESGR